jgi:hypothetical protein
MSASVALTLVFGAPTAFAQSEEEIAGARAAATAGAKAFQEERWQDAVDLFTRAESLLHAPPHLLFLARAQTKLGRFVAARELYNKIIREPLSSDAPEPFRNAQRAAETEIRDIEPRLSRLTVQVKGVEPAKAAVTIDGRPLSAALVGVPHPADPGAHELRASAEGFITASQSVELPEGGEGAVTLVLEPDPNAKPADVGPEAGPAAVPTAPALATPADAGETESGPNLAVPAYAALGVGALGLGAGVLFTLQSASKRSDGDEAFERCELDGGGSCLDSELAQEGNALYDEAGTAQTMAAIGYIVGGVGVAAGVTLLLLDGSSTAGDAGSAPHVRAWVGYRTAGISGTF